MSRSSIEDHVARSQRQSPFPGETGPLWVRAKLLLFGLILTTLALWVLLAETYRARPIELPAVEAASRALQAKRDDAGRAASLAVVRGDLWAESAFTYANLLWSGTAQDSEATQAPVAEARKDLENALRYSPHRGDVWLMLADLAEKNHWQNYVPASLLRMSYYTAPNEFALFPLRIKASLRSGTIDDPEIQDMSKHDIRQVLTKIPALRPALVDAYKQASPAGKAFVERVISGIDPTYLALLRAGML